MTPALLTAVMPHLLPQRAANLLPFLDAACAEAGITTPLRLAAFLAQLAHESAELRYFEELADGSAYEGRLDLGNVMPGDGRHYKGRGPIQLTGRTNYRAAGVALGLDLEAHPEQVATPAVGFRVAGWFWTSRRLNALADAGLFSSITRQINGGLNGELAREAYYTAALRALGARRPQAAP
jgi:putative chitinase